MYPSPPKNKIIRQARLAAVVSICTLLAMPRHNWAVSRMSGPPYRFNKPWKFTPDNYSYRELKVIRNLSIGKAGVIGLVKTMVVNMKLSRYSILLLLSVFLALDTGETQALECGNPQPGDTSVECTSSSDTDDVIVNVQGVTDITATDSDGISGILNSTAHNRSNNVDITVTGTTITTNGDMADGIYGGQNGSTGNVDITATDTTITTNGSTAHGIYGEGTTTHTGNINIEAIGSNITTNSNDASGINVQHQGMSGNIDITASGNTIITTKDLLAHGIHVWVLDPDNNSDIGTTINLQNIEITTEGTQTLFDDTISHGVFVENEGSGGDIIIDANAGTIITTKGIFSIGIFGKHEGVDDIRINVHRDASIISEGEYSYGIYGDHRASGDVYITTDFGSTITTTGANGHGITAYQRSTTDPGVIDIVVEGTIHTSGADAQGVRVGTLSSGAPSRVAAFDMDGFRQQTVTVNGSITSNVEGVFIAGGGRVIIGPRGSIDSESNIAILATGEVPADDSDPNNVIPAIPPKLWVDLNLGGRQVAQALGDNWIINDGGETTIAVNNVVLHDGETGVTGSTAHNGVWNVTMREHGVKLDDYTNSDPSMWTRIQSTAVAPIIADRDFSSADFAEMRVRCPAGQIGFPNCRVPPPPMCPDGQVGTPPDCIDAETDTDTEMPMFMEEYAPRAALYESLPGFLLRMAAQGPLNHRLVSKQSPVWMAFSGGSGEVDPSRSTTGAEYDYDRYRVQLGKNLSFGGGLEGWFAVHYTQGDSEVSSPTGGGDIDVEGAGATFNIQWQHDSGYYLDGRTSFTAYDVDLSSDDVGRLRSSVDALGTSLGFEAGRRMAMGETFQMTPRAWLSHSSVDIDSFTDAVDAQASFPDEVRLTGGIGALAETLRHWKGGELTWHGSLDLEQMLNSRSTNANVSGEQLKTETVSTRVLLGLGSLYQKGDFSISAQISVDGLGTDDEDYSGQVNIGVRL